MGFRINLSFWEVQRLTFCGERIPDGRGEESHGLFEGPYLFADLRDSSRS